MPSKAERGVAIFEALKGAVMLLAGFGLLGLLHKNIRLIAESLVFHLHLDPNTHYPHLFLQQASHVGDRQIWLFAIYAIFYSGLRWLEAYGLWFNLRWGRWVALISGGLYLPLELLEIAKHFSWLTLLVLLGNIAVLLYMAYKIKHD
jgi:uncharacterized membrane protein (DUF2068 family)